jgi:predicted Zn-dependent protease
VKRSILITILALAALNLRAATPTQTQLETALAAARAAWGIDVEASIRLDHSQGCEMLDVTKKRSGKAEPASANETIALTQTVQTKMITDSDDPAIPPVVVNSLSSVININAACDWNDAYLRKIVMHEYGHALGLQHSENRNSIMYWLVFAPSAERLYGSQAITAADLNAAAISKASKDHQKDAETAGH